MLADYEKEKIELTNQITEELVNNSIEQINKKYSDNYHQQNPHLLSAFIELHKTIYLSTCS